MAGRRTEPSSASAFEPLLAEAARASSIPLSSPWLEPALSPGELLFGDRFKIHRRLGAGGTGVAYEAFDRERECTVALKLLSCAEPARILRFKGEFRALADMVHPHLVRLHGLFNAQSRWFFTMDLLHAVPFDEGFGPVPSSAVGAATRYDRLRSALLQLTDGLVALHATGKVHRDLKPSNVLVAHAGHVTIVDFGLVTDRDQPSDAALIAGTPGYIAPERMRGVAAAPASDWYAVGVMLHEVLVGRMPRAAAAIDRGRVSRKHHPQRRTPALEPLDLPRDLVEICRGLLREEPAERFGADAVRAKLQGAGFGQAMREPAPQRVPPFVGRQRELARLAEALSAARSGGCITRRVCGPSGIGKTALVREFLQRSGRELGTVVLSGQCYEREFTPYKLLDGIVDRLAAHLLERFPPARVGGSREQLERRAASAQQIGVASYGLESEDARPLWSALARLFPALARIDFVGRASASFDPAVDGREQRRRAAEGLRRALGSVDPTQTLIVHIDDAQWSDADGAELWAQVLEAGPPLLFVVSHRSDEDNPHLEALLSRVAAAGHDVREIGLSGLDDTDLRAIAQHVSGAHAGNLDVIAREARGSPYFTLELARYAARDGADADAGAPGAQVSTAESLTLERALFARTRMLPADDRTLLELVALAGVPLSRRVLAAACPLLDVDRALAALRQEGFVRTRIVEAQELADTYHDRVRDNVLVGLGAREREALHGALARALEAKAPDSIELLATHFAGAGNRERAAHYALLAGRRAARALAFERATTWLREALKYPLWKSREVRCIATELGDVLAMSGFSADAADAYAQAAAAGRDSGRRVLELQVAGQLLCGGQLQRGIAQLREALRETEAPLPVSAGMAATWVVLARCWATRKNLLRPRSSGLVSADDIARVDACYWAALGLSGPTSGEDLVSHEGLVPYMVLRQLWEALRVREPLRMVRAVHYVAALNARSDLLTVRQFCAALLALAGRAERHLDDPRIEFWHQFRLAWRAFWDFDPAATMQRWHAAQRLVAGGACHGVERELVLLRMIALWGALQLGEVETYLRGVEQLQREARDRRDEHAAALAELLDVKDLLAGNFATRVARIDAVLARYGTDAPRARSYLTEFELQAAAAERAGGQEAAAWGRIQRVSRAFRASLAWKLPRMRAVLLLEEAACALSLAARGSTDRHRLLARAETNLRETPAPAHWLSCVRAGLAWQKGQRSAALSLLEQIAVEGGTRLGHWAPNSARIVYGLAVGGRAGEEWVREGERALHAVGALAPRSWARMYIPGIPIPD